MEIGTPLGMRDTVKAIALSPDFLNYGYYEEPDGKQLISSYPDVPMTIKFLLLRIVSSTLKDSEFWMKSKKHPYPMVRDMFHLIHSAQYLSPNPFSSSMGIYLNNTFDMSNDLLRMMNTLVKMNKENKVSLDAADMNVMKSFAEVCNLVLKKNNARSASVIDPLGDINKAMVGNLVIDFDRFKAYICGIDLHLTLTEFKILSILSRNPGKIIPYQYIAEAIWGNDGWIEDNQLIRVNMSNIRKKISGESPNQIYIDTKPGVGYRMVTQSEWAKNERAKVKESKSVLLKAQ